MAGCIAPSPNSDGLAALCRNAETSASVPASFALGASVIGLDARCCEGPLAVERADDWVAEPPAAAFGLDGRFLEGDCFLAMQTFF